MQQQILVFGEPLKSMPKDLYIPPDALRILLEAFEGPLDLLLYLIRKHNIDILDIPVALITEQYLCYVEVMKQEDMNVVAEYLLMAATLAEIKARMMLPLPTLDNEEDEPTDPRAELAAQLLAYAQLSKAAERLSALPFVGCGTVLSGHSAPVCVPPPEPPPADCSLLLNALQQIYNRQALHQAHAVAEERWSLSARMAIISTRLGDNIWHELTDFHTSSEGRGGLVVALMAMLELDKRQQICWRQESAFAPIYLRQRIEETAA